MIELTAEERQAVMSGRPVRLQLPDIGKNVVLLLEAEFDRLQQLLEDDKEDRLLQNGWQKLAYRGLTLSADDQP